VKTASSIDALARLQSGIFDLLVTDILMPGMDGLSLVRRAKALHAELLVIVITGHAGQYSLDEVVAAGASDLLLKPFRAPELRARVKLATEHRAALQEWKARKRALQRASAQVIQGLQRELEEARQVPARRESAAVDRGTG
jgi:CheY-like chemotaxis protein